MFVGDWNIAPKATIKTAGLGKLEQQPLASDSLREPYIRLNLVFKPNQQKALFQQIDNVTKIELQTCVFNHVLPGLYFVKFRSGTNHIPMHQVHNIDNISNNGLFVHTDNSVTNGTKRDLECFRTPVNFNCADIEVYDMDGKIVTNYLYLYLGFKIFTLNYQL